MCVLTHIVEKINKGQFGYGPRQASAINERIYCITLMLWVCQCKYGSEPLA